MLRTACAAVIVALAAPALAAEPTAAEILAKARDQGALNLARMGRSEIESTVDRMYRLSGVNDRFPKGDSFQAIVAPGAKVGFAPTATSQTRTVLLVKSSTRNAASRFPSGLNANPADGTRAWLRLPT